jgi:signal transduction histidine kinase
MRLVSHAMISLIAVFVPISLSAEPLPRSVLVLDQSIPHTAWFSRLFGAFQSTLKAGSDTPITIYTERLEYSHFKGSEYDQIMRTFIKAKYREKPIGITVAIGLAAFEFAVGLRDYLDSSMPIVFGDIDDRVSAISKLPADVTGITVRSTLHDAVISAKALVPNLKRIALVGDPFEQQTFRRHYKEELPVYANDLEKIDLMGLAMPELRKRVAALPEDTAIFYTSLSIDGTGARYDPNDALALVAEVANRPIVIDLETRLGYGGAGGFLLTADPIGEATARIVLRLLNGESASTIPITTGEFVKPVFDGRALKRWNVSEERLPPGSEIRFRETTAWEQYRWQILAIATALLLQSGMIIALFYEHRRRRFAEVEARRRMAELAHINRVATAGELSASIAHELKQPLAAIATNGSAALRWLARATPNLDEARAALKRVVDDGRRAGQLIGNIRAMFKRDDPGRSPLDVNDLIREVMVLSRDQLNRHRVAIQTDLFPALPQVSGNPVQLQQVILNLIMNAAEAMDAVTDRPRVLRVKTEPHEPSSVMITVQDSGPGIDRENSDRIFDTFFTTKSHGMGMGLSICRSIVEAHGGRLWASNGTHQGAVFHIVLPSGLS